LWVYRHQRSQTPSEEIDLSQVCPSVGTVARWVTVPPVRDGADDDLLVIST
jgi:hypothetical protein